jgi:hypothetical protein
MAYNKTNQTPPVNIRQVTLDLRQYWGNLVPADAYFTAKVSYSKGGEQIIRVFKTEISKGDCYLELVDFDGNFLEAEARTLFRIPFHHDWEDRYPQMTDVTKGPNIQIPYNSLEVIAREKPLNQTQLQEAQLMESAPELEDEHAEAGRKDMLQTGMTARDLYAITHNVPLSNKGWVNNMIRQGREYLKKNPLTQPNA